MEGRRNSSFEDCDVLYYEAIVTRVHRMPNPGKSSSTVGGEEDAVTHYDLHFEDDCPQTMIPAAWVIPNTRKTIAERGHARVIFGHADTHERWREITSWDEEDHDASKNKTALPSTTPPREILLMVFTECPTLYQSAVALKSSSLGSSSPRTELILDHTLLPFEQHQCFSLIASLAGGRQRQQHLVRRFTKDGRTLTTDDDATQRQQQPPLSFAVLGGGGCALPTALRQLVQEAGDALPVIEIDVVESDPDVTSMAREHFGATDSTRFRLREGDAAAFLRDTADGSFDAVIIDVASTVADASADQDEDGVVLPPEEFVSGAFLNEQLCRCLADDGGVCVVNVIGGRVALRRVAERFRSCFPSPGGAAVLCTDPNYLFWGFKGYGGWSGGGGNDVEVDGVGGAAADEGGGGGGDGGGAPAPSEVLAAAAAFPGLEALCPFAFSLVRNTRRHLDNQDLMGWVTVDEFVAMLDNPAVIV